MTGVAVPIWPYGPASASARSTMVPVAPVLVLAVHARVADVPPVADTAVGGASVAPVNAPVADDASVNRARLTGTATVMAMKPSARSVSQLGHRRRCVAATSAV